MNKPEQAGPIVRDTPQAELPRSPSSPVPSSAVDTSPEAIFFKPTEVPSRGEEELGKLLDITMKAFWEESGAPMCPLEMPNYRAARQSIESYVSRLRGEIERRKEINHALVESNGILIGESIGLTAALASLKEQQLTPEEAQEFLWLIDNSSGNEDPDTEPLRAKLRLLSTSDSEQITFNRGFVG